MIDDTLSNKEDAMTEKSKMPRSRSQKRRPADLLAISSMQNKVELGEESLKMISAGGTSSNYGKHINKISLVTVKK